MIKLNMKCKDKSIDNTWEREGKNHDEYKPQTFQFFVIIYCIRIQLSSLVSTGPQSSDCYKIVQYIDLYWLKLRCTCCVHILWWKCFIVLLILYFTSEYSIKRFNLLKKIKTKCILILKYNHILKTMPVKIKVHQNNNSYIK